MNELTPSPPYSGERAGRAAQRVMHRHSAQSPSQQRRVPRHLRAVVQMPSAPQRSVVQLSLREEGSDTTCTALLVPSFAGFGYAYTNVSKKMTFTMSAQAVYRYDFLAADAKFFMDTVDSLSVSLDGQPLNDVFRRVRLLNNIGFLELTANTFSRTSSAVTQARSPIPPPPPVARARQAPSAARSWFPPRSPRRVELHGAVGAHAHRLAQRLLELLDLLGVGRAAVVGHDGGRAVRRERRPRPLSGRQYLVQRRRRAARAPGPAPRTSWAQRSSSACSSPPPSSSS